ncbi:hypothetical protein [Arcicella lustrica]|uniref:Lipoprotein n=1 Tax=Arcicella lustrica TaxID=2984196 RepID=A0ABU5SMI8_9BACT|nr:hypothetical protein [Arcicella sp. DC25W]MEA5428481.1 hypothetical protein [Arcicella sp. DC25W]
MNSQQINYKLTQLDLKAKLNEQQYPFQFSSIVIKNDSIILVAEKCNRIYILNKKTLDVISVINDLVFPKDKVSIEGVVLYKNRYLFLLDENNTAIYSYDLKDQKSNIKRIDDNSLEGNQYKLEGIAINEKDSICYVLHEDKLKIYLFDIGKDNQLKKRERINSINLPKDNISWTRNTDLVYENNQLYVLSTTYGDGKPDKLKYGISLFSIGGDYTLTYQNTIELIFPESFDYYRLERYSTNLEGLVKDSNLFYVISDNADSDRDNCDTQINGIKKTLFFKLERE